VPSTRAIPPPLARGQLVVTDPTVTSVLRAQPLLDASQRIVVSLLVTN